MEPSSNQIIYHLDTNPRTKAIVPGFLLLGEQEIPGFLSVVKKVDFNGQQYQVTIFYPQDQVNAAVLADPYKNNGYREEFVAVVKKMIEFAETFKLSESNKYYKLRLQGNKKEESLYFFDETEKYKKRTLLTALDKKIVKAEKDGDATRHQRLDKLKKEQINQNRLGGTAHDQRNEVLVHNDLLNLDFHITDCDITEDKLKRAKKGLGEDNYKLLKEELKTLKDSQPRPHGLPRGEIRYLGPVIEPSKNIESEAQFVQVHLTTMQRIFAPTTWWSGSSVAEKPKASTVAPAAAPRSRAPTVVEEKLKESVLNAEPEAPVSKASDKASAPPPPPPPAKKPAAVVSEAPSPKEPPSPPPSPGSNPAAAEESPSQKGPPPPPPPGPKPAAKGSDQPVSKPAAESKSDLMASIRGNRPVLRATPKAPGKKPTSSNHIENALRENIEKRTGALNGDPQEQKNEKTETEDQTW